MLPEHIRKKLNETRRIDLAPTLARERSRIAIVSGPADFTAIPYDIILNGPDAVAAALAADPDTLSRVIGIFCNSYNEIRAAAAAAAATVGVPANCQYALAAAVADESNYGAFRELYGEFPLHESASAFAAAVVPGAEPWLPGSKLPRLHLLLQLWKPADADRWLELKTALFLNATNPLVYKIHILLDGAAAAEAYADWPAALKGKLVAYPSADRLTYKFALNYMAALPCGDFAALINSDIYFNESVRELWNISMKNRCLALLRFEVGLAYAIGKQGAVEPRIFGPRADSQDTWIFAVDELVAHQAAGESWAELGFCMGKPGCDNAIAGELLRRKWALANPAYTIRTMHIHENPRRGYTVDELVSLGIYVHLAPVAVS
jgi:hypothetical protein